MAMAMEMEMELETETETTNLKCLVVEWSRIRWAVVDISNLKAESHLQFTICHLGLVRTHSLS